MTDTAIAELAPQCRGAGRMPGGRGRAGQLLPAPPPSAPPARSVPIPHRDRHQPRALSQAERHAILDVLHSDRFVDMAPAEVWATLLDDGVYLGSISTFYRLLRQAGETRERRRQATHPATVKPELVAYQPNSVWSWDITKLRGPAKWTLLLPVRDLGHLLPLRGRLDGRHPRIRGSGRGADPPDLRQAGHRADQLTIHADRGSSMTSKPVAFLLADLGVTQSHSRPHVSDDNPFSEAQFKTLKYRPDFPDRFDSIEAARRHCQTFFAWYNDEHRHTGLGLHTPADVHYGTAASSATSAPPCSTPHTGPTPNGSSASRQSRQTCPPARGSTRPTTQRRPLSKYRSTVPHSG